MRGSLFFIKIALAADGKPPPGEFTPGKDASSRIEKCSGEQAEMRACESPSCTVEACIDCIWGDWQDYTPCQCEGLQERHRTVQQLNNDCGKPCEGARVETQECQAICTDPPQDCELGNWDNWSACDKDCGGGQMFRTRDILKESTAGGEGCEAVLKETLSCNEEECYYKTDCNLSVWEEWTDCSHTCGVGQQTRKRQTVILAQHGGKACAGPLQELRKCEERDCENQIDCVWGMWGEWSACSQSCGGGNRGRSRLIDVAPRFGGQLCEPLAMSEVGPCSLNNCLEKIDCEFRGWSEWDACSCSCNGIQNRIRHVGRYPEHGGDPCDGSLREVRSCNEDTCKEEPKPDDPVVDCGITEWNVWSQCSVTCGRGGFHKRYRTVTEQPAAGGEACEDALEIVEPCATHTCPLQDDDSEPPKDCLWSHWDDWGACSASCGGGEKVRQRQIIIMPNSSGEPCEDAPSMEVRSCNETLCGCNDCTFAEWSEWGACTCTGLEERHRAIQDTFSSCGKPCEGSKCETRSCMPDCLAKQESCEFEEWISWSDCTATCGGGQRERIRSLNGVARNGGSACEGSTKEVDDCGVEDCYFPIDCEISDWDEWSTCSRTCGGGQRQRGRHIIRNVQHGGKACENSISQIESCGEELCAKVANCLWDDWEEWGACTQTCGGGQRSRTRAIAVAPKSGGELCEPFDKEEIEPCNVDECGLGCVDAKWEEWSIWTECSASCGQAYQSRARCLAQGANWCGKGVEGLTEEFRPCSVRECDDVKRDCALSQWTDWSPCSCACNGVAERARRVIQYPENGGKGCTAPIKQIKPCNVDKCRDGPQVDCQLDPWSDWSNCDHACNGGIQLRNRSVAIEPKNMGKGCEGVLSMVQTCNTQACPGIVDCVWGQWNTWGACSLDCGGGQRSRYRHITQMAHGGGKPCTLQSSTAIESCNARKCSESSFCAWSIWEQWSECSTTCGSGENERRRYLTLASEPPDVGMSESKEILQKISMGQVNTATVESLGIVFCSGALASALIFFAITMALKRRNSIRFEAAPTTCPDSIELLGPDHAE